MKIKITVFLIIIFSIFSCNTAAPPRTVKFTVNLDSPQVLLGEIEFQVRRSFPLTGLNKINAEVTYYPIEDAVGIKYRSEFITYNQFWNLEGRKIFINALENYNNDYAARNLPSNNRRTRQAYGSTEGYLTWQMYQYTFLAKGNVDLDLGYFFNNRSPYFTITQNKALYEDPISYRENRESTSVTIAFTRAQAQELANLFDQEFLLESIPDDLIPSVLRSRSRSVDDEIVSDEW